MSPNSFLSLPWIIALTFCCVGAVRGAEADIAIPRNAGGPEYSALWSSSRQFVVKGPTTAVPSPAFLANQTGNRATPTVLLEPSTLIVTAERVKTALLRALGLPDVWKGRITVWLHPSRGPNDSVLLENERFLEGWRHQLHLPNEMTAANLVSALTSALLTELSSRGAEHLTSEVPTWLVEGLSMQMQQKEFAETLTLSAPVLAVPGVRSTVSSGSGRYNSPADHMRTWMLQQEPLPFDDLSWPQSEWLAHPDHLLLYRQSSFWFVHQLISLPEGQARLVRWLGMLHSSLNWQTTFLDSFTPLFGDLREVEKWWSVQTARLTRPTTLEPLNLAQSRERLSQILQARVEVRANTNDLPMRATISLATAVQQWPIESQVYAVRESLTQLLLIRPYLARPFSPLADDYIRVLRTYLDKVDRLVRRQRLSSLAAVSEETHQELKKLDLKRQARSTPPTERVRQTPPP